MKQKRTCVNSSSALSYLGYKKKKEKKDHSLFCIIYLSSLRRCRKNKMKEKMKFIDVKNYSMNRKDFLFFICIFVLVVITINNHPLCFSTSLAISLGISLCTCYRQWWFNGDKTAPLL